MRQAIRSSTHKPDAEASPSLHASTEDAALRRRRAEGRLAIHTWADGLLYRAAAYIVVPRLVGGWRYTANATGFHDSAYYGSALTLQFSVQEARPWSADQHGAAGVRERGAAFWVWLSSISGPASAQAEAVAGFEARFAGMRVAVEIEMDRRRTPG
jgi:hypothetical protein